MNGRLQQSKFLSRIRGTVIRQALLFSLAALSLSVLAGCFDYEEKIVFHRDFSGIIELNYSVPVDEESGRSLISFLPARPIDIEARYAGQPLQPEVQDFRSERTHSEPFDIARVSYRIRFHAAKELETYLPGETQVFQAGGALRLYRSFPGLESGTEGREIRLYRLAYRTIMEQLKGRTMKFSIVCPWYFDLSSNQGTLPSPGVVYFAYPLDRSMVQTKETLWSVEIRANPAPEEVTKKLQAPSGPPQ